MGRNKVIFGNETLIDLTGDTVTPQTLMQGETAHNRAGEAIVGTATGGGGHTIVNTNGTTMPARVGLQFDGLNVEDDQQNNKTIVHGNIKVCQTEDEWLDLLANDPDQANDPNVQWFLPWMSSERFVTDRSPVGTVISVGVDTTEIPVGQIYWPTEDYLICNGTSIKVSDYPQLANYFETAYGDKYNFGGSGANFSLPNWSVDYPENGILCIKASISSTIITEAEVDETGISSATDKVPSCARVAAIEAHETAGNWIQIQNGYNHYRKCGEMVMISLQGNIALDSSGYVNNFTLPVEYRPSITLYFICTRGGNVSTAPHLCYVNHEGKIYCYTRGESIDYLYGNIFYIKA